MNCVEELRGEHALIRGVLDGLEAVSVRLRRGLPASPNFMAAAAAFVGEFVVACHERKEDDGLFATLRHLDAARGDGTIATIGTNGPEHRRVRHALGVTSRALARRDPDAHAHLDSCIAVLRRHLTQEERRLFPLVQGRTSRDDDDRVLATFRDVERAWLGTSRLDAMRAVTFALAGHDVAAQDGSGGSESAGHGDGGQPPQPPSTDSPLVRDVMRTDVARVAPGESLAHAAAAMRARTVREVAVVEEDILVGLLTQSDLLPHQGHLEWTLVRSVMTREVHTISPQARVDHAAWLLLEHSVNALPVVVAGRLVGMLGRADLLRVVTRSGGRGTRPSS